MIRNKGCVNQTRKKKKKKQKKKKHIRIAQFVKESRARDSDWAPF